MACKKRKLSEESYLLKYGRTWIPPSGDNPTHSSCQKAGLRVSCVQLVEKILMGGLEVHRSKRGIRPERSHVSSMLAANLIIDTFPF